MKHCFLLLGASSGIGLALAEVLVKKQHQVVLVARRQEPMAELQNQYPDLVNHYQLDLTQPSISEALDEIYSLHPEINRIVYLAGWGDLNANLDPHIELKTQELNTHSFTKVAVWGTGVLSTATEAVFVNISSLAGLRGGGFAPAYNASKAYQINYWEGLRQRATKQKLPLRYCDVRPGFVDTDMAKGEGQFWVASPKKAAKQLARKIAKKRAKDVPEIFYLTKRWKIIAIILKILPNWLYKSL